MPTATLEEVEQDQAHEGHARHSVDQAVPTNLAKELLRQLCTTDRRHGEAGEKHAVDLRRVPDPEGFSVDGREDDEITAKAEENTTEHSTEQRLGVSHTREHKEEGDLHQGNHTIPDREAVRNG